MFRGDLVKEGGRGWPFQGEGGSIFYKKNKLKSEIFHDKKNLKQKCFSLS